MPGTSRPTVLRAAVEVRKPSIFGELIIALTFVPIATLQGMEGKMFSPLAYTVALALLASLLLSIFVIPTVCLVTLKTVHRASPVFTLARRLYLPLLTWALRRRGIVVAGAGVVLLAALLAAPRLGTEFLPVMDEGAFDMDVQLIPGVSLDHALRTAGEIERRLKRFPELDTIVSRTGQTGVAIEARGVDKTGFVGALKPRRQWTSARTREELMDRMRAELADIPGMVFSFSQPIQCRIDELVAGTRAQVIVKLFGDDTEVLRRKTAEMAVVLGRIRGATDLVVERVAGQPYLTIVVDRDKVARYGVNTGDVLRVIELAIAGKPLSRLYQQNRAFDIALRFPEERRQSVEALGSLLIDVPGGYRVALNQLAELKAVEGPTQISREDGQRRIGIELNVVGRDIGSFVKEAQSRLAESVALPAGYYVNWGGQFENQQQATNRLMIITPVVLGLIFLLLLFTFDSVWLAGLVLVNLPFAMVGGVFALLVTGLYLSVPASVGFIVLLGVAVLNGLVLVSCMSDLRERRRERVRSRADRLRDAAPTGADDGQHCDPQPRSDGLRDGARVGGPAAARRGRDRWARDVNRLDAPGPPDSVQLAGGVEGRQARGPCRTRRGAPLVGLQREHEDGLSPLAVDRRDLHNWRAAEQVPVRREVAGAHDQVRHAGGAVPAPDRGRAGSPSRRPRIPPVGGWSAREAPPL